MEPGTLWEGENSRSVVTRDAVLQILGAVTVHYMILVSKRLWSQREGVINSSAASYTCTVLLPSVST